MSKDDNYDLIIIGSGMGALACANIMARLKGWRVLMLERHFKVGGFTHMFKRKNRYHWDVGVHYVGGLQEGSMMRQLFDLLSDGSLKWNKMPDPFEKFVYPDFTFSVPDDPERYRSRLIEQFPDEKQAIEHYFEDVRITAGWFGKHVTMKSVPPALSSVARLLTLKGRGEAMMTTGDYMMKNFKDPKLRAVLLSQWGDYGLPPSQSAFVIHSLIVEHYLHGGYYPVGGSSKIAESFMPAVESAGGQVLINHIVDEIIVEDGIAVGVRAREVKGTREEKKEFRAPHIVSNAGAHNTYLKLLPKDYSQEYRKDLERMQNGTANVTLYIGLKQHPGDLGFKGENYWIFDDYDHDSIFSRRNEIIEGRAGCMYLSFPSLKDPESKAHTAEVITFCDYEPFQKWKEDPWLKRGDEYQAMKDRISTGLLQGLERHFPGFTELVDFCELSTPLSTEHFTGHVRGTIYGMPCTPERFDAEFIGPKTNVKNLFLTGADASSPGLAGALMGGFATSTQLLGASGMIRLFKDLRKANLSS